MEDAESDRQEHCLCGRWGDSNQASASGTYIIDTPALTDIEDGSGKRLACSYTSYDGPGVRDRPASSQVERLLPGLATRIVVSYPIATRQWTNHNQHTYDAYGNLIATNDADANAGIAGHNGCRIGNAQYTGCTTYDSTFATLETSSTNTLNQTSSTSYGSGAFGGYGLWPFSGYDINRLPLIPMIC